MRCLARPSHGHKMTVLAVSAMPSHEVSAAAPSIKVSIASAATYGASRKKLTPTHFCARRSARSEIVRVPVKRQMTMTLARPSIALSRPKATKAIDPAKIPAITPTVPSIPSQTSVNVASSLARRAKRNHDGLPVAIVISVKLHQPRLLDQSDEFVPFG